MDACISTLEPQFTNDSLRNMDSDSQGFIKRHIEPTLSTCRVRLIEGYQREREVELSVFGKLSFILFKTMEETFCSVFS